MQSCNKHIKNTDHFIAHYFCPAATPFAYLCLIYTHHTRTPFFFVQMGFILEKTKLYTFLAMRSDWRAHTFIYNSTKEPDIWPQNELKVKYRE